MSDINMDDSFGEMKEDQAQADREAGSPATGERKEGGQGEDEAGSMES